MSTVSVNALSKSTARLGFIGLGLMGSRVTRRLHSSGWDIRAWNRSPVPVGMLGSASIGIAPSLASLVADSDVILSCLANDAAVRSVYFDKGGLFSSSRPGTTILEMSTISPQLSKLL